METCFKKKILDSLNISGENFEFENSNSSQMYSYKVDSEKQKEQNKKLIKKN